MAVAGRSGYNEDAILPRAALVQELLEYKGDCTELAPLKLNSILYFIEGQDAPVKLEQIKGKDRKKSPVTRNCNEFSSTFYEKYLKSTTTPV
jgi:hypothetical protein